MTQIFLKFTASELDLLCSLASDQLFRREFIDSRLPGYEPNPEGLRRGKKLIERMRSTAEWAKRMPPSRRNGTTV